MKDSTIINKLWWLRKFLNSQWGEREYKEICEEKLSDEIAKEVDELVAYIKENY
jgi:hypothetical protein